MNCGVCNASQAAHAAEVSGLQEQLRLLQERHAAEVQALQSSLQQAREDAQATRGEREVHCCLNPECLGMSFLARHMLWTLVLTLRVGSCVGGGYT